MGGTHQSYQNAPSTPAVETGGNHRLRPPSCDDMGLGLGWGFWAVRPLREKSPGCRPGGAQLSFCREGSRAQKHPGCGCGSAGVSVCAWAYSSVGVCLRVSLRCTRVCMWRGGRWRTPRGKVAPALGLPWLGPCPPPLAGSAPPGIRDSPAPGAGGRARILAGHTVLAPSAACCVVNKRPVTHRLPMGCEGGKGHGGLWAGLLLPLPGWAPVKWRELSPGEAPTVPHGTGPHRPGGLGFPLGSEQRALQRHIIPKPRSPLLI